MKYHQYILQLNEKKKKLNFQNSELKAAITSDWEELKESLKPLNLSKQFVQGVLIKSKPNSIHDSQIANWKIILKNILRKNYMTMSDKCWKWVSKKLFSYF